MKNVAFFFGAGAEGQGNFKIRTGFDYMKSSLYASEELKGFDDALSAFWGKEKKYFNNKFAYCKNLLDVSHSLLKNFITQKASHNQNFYNKYNDVILGLLNDEDLRHVCDVLDIQNAPKHKTAQSVDEDIKTIKKEFKEIVTNKDRKYSSIKNSILKDLFNEVDDDKIGFDLNIGIADSLDKYFHTIIDPYKYSVVRFSKIFNYYWACYFTILHDVVLFLKEHGAEDLKKYLHNENELDYQFILQNIEQFTKDLYNVNVCDLAPPKSYYKLIRQELDKYRNEINCVGVMTTNYFRFCEIVCRKSIYLNGQLKYFEYPELLEIVDMTKESQYKDKLLFPFIFGQSLVKPIVNSVQTEEFHRLHELLNGNDSANILVVLGFNVNEDDNHINAFLHDYVKRGKKLVIITDDERFHVARKLKCSETEVSVCKVNYGCNEAVVKAIFEEIINDSM